MDILIDGFWFGVVVFFTPLVVPAKMRFSMTAAPFREDKL